jgi:hypothetical protein
MLAFLSLVALLTMVRYNPGPPRNAALLFIIAIQLPDRPFNPCSIRSQWCCTG